MVSQPPSPVVPALALVRQTLELNGKVGQHCLAQGTDSSSAFKDSLQLKLEQGSYSKCAFDKSLRQFQSQHLQTLTMLPPDLLPSAGVPRLPACMR